MKEEVLESLLLDYFTEVEDQGLRYGQHTSKLSDVMAEMRKDIPIIYKALRLEFASGELRQALNEHQRKVRLGKEYVLRKAKKA